MDITSLIDPGCTIVAVACYFLGVMLKATPKVSDWLIPYLLTAFAILLCCILEFTTKDEVGMNIFNGIIQGFLCAGMSVYVNQLYKQGKEK